MRDAPAIDRDLGWGPKARHNNGRAVDAAVNAILTHDGTQQARRLAAVSAKGARGHISRSRADNVYGRGSPPEHWLGSAIHRAERGAAWHVARRGLPRAPPTAVPAHRGAWARRRTHPGMPARRCVQDTSPPPGPRCAVQLRDRATQTDRTRRCGVAVRPGG